MTVHIYGPEDDASQIDGFTIVVDVFRAFSNSYRIWQNGPRFYYAVSRIETAFEMKRRLPDVILIGERDCIKIDGFDYGNSPTEIAGKDFTGKTVVHTTTSGTQGLLRQPPGNRVAAGSFVNCAALIQHITQNGIGTVNVYCTASRDAVYGHEDYVFAEYFRKRLLGGETGFESIRRALLAENIVNFSDEGFAPYSDFEFCTQLDRFDCILERKAAPFDDAVLLDEIPQ